MLNLDVSVLFVIIIIWLLMAILNKIYYKPVGKVIQERERRIEEDTQKLVSMTRGIEEKTGQVEKILHDSRKESLQIREDLIGKGEAVREQFIIDARARSKALFEKKMKELNQELVRAEKHLSQQIDRFSEQIKDAFL
jgi:F-type H+-transporting ATPase subunit b